MDRNEPRVEVYEDIQPDEAGLKPELVRAICEALEEGRLEDALGNLDRHTREDVLAYLRQHGIIRSQ